MGRAPTVIASEAKQFSLAAQRSWIASFLAMTLRAATNQPDGQISNSDYQNQCQALK
jgi:hypothetical protein